MALWSGRNPNLLYGRSYEPALACLSEAALIRPTAAEDLPHLESVIDAVELFPSDMLAGMLAPYLSGDGTQDQWLTCEDGAPLGVAYFVPERLTDRTWNLLLIAVHPDHQGKGHGAALLRSVEAALGRLGRAHAADRDLGAGRLRSAERLLPPLRLRGGSTHSRLLSGRRRQSSFPKSSGMKPSARPTWYPGRYFSSCPGKARLFARKVPAADARVDRIAQAPDVGVESRQTLRRLT